MPDDDQGASWPPRWELPPDLDPPAGSPGPGPGTVPQAAVPREPAPPPTTWALPPGLSPTPSVENTGATGTTGAIEAPPPRDGRPGSGRRVLVAGAVAAVVVAIGVVLAVARPWAPHDTTTAGAGDSAGSSATPRGADAGTPANAPANAATDDGPATVTASADCVSPPSKDAGGNPTSYVPGNAVDDRPETAWRCDGDGVGHQLHIDLGRSLTLSAVGLIPGLAKTDPYDGTDRYLQCRRISAVRLTFDDGSSVTANLDTSPDNRSVQQVPLSPVTTRSVTVTVLASVEGSPVGAFPATDKVAISTLTWTS